MYSNTGTSNMAKAIKYKFVSGTHYVHGSRKMGLPMPHWYIREAAKKFTIDPDCEVTTRKIKESILDTMAFHLGLNPIYRDLSRDVTVEFSDEEVVAYSTNDLDGRGFIARWKATQ